ncbi:hypothetical protein CGRA01v4_05226 [Colletotrichum graminicola]|nr:hypothetical protein CGRA01v4_05226 [Colletotrichum graminicola]
MGSFLSFALFVFTVNTHYRLATAWHPSRRVASREMGGKNAWTTRNDGYPSCVYLITPFSLLFMIFSFLFSLRVTILCSDGALCFVFLSDGDCGKGQTVWLPTAFLFYDSCFSRELKRR